MHTIRFTSRIASASLLIALANCADDSTPKLDAEANEAGAPADARSNADANSSSDAGAGTSDGSTASSDAGSTNTDASGTSTDAGSDASAQASQDASSDASASKISCDHRKVVCRIAEPSCPANQVASVENSCFGPCVVIDQCSCAQAEECPHEEMYVCHRSAKHCGPYVN